MLKTRRMVQRAQINERQHMIEGVNPGGPIRRNTPREVLQMTGMTREPVGGNAVQISSAQPGQPIQQPTGFTRPLTVTNLSAEIFPVDFSRKFLFVQNNDALGIVFVSIGGQAAALNQGFRLAANGGSVLLDINVPTDRIFMIGTIANNPNVTAITG